jgi:hypothetical protein
MRSPCRMYSIYRHPRQLRNPDSTRRVPATEAQVWTLCKRDPSTPRETQRNTHTHAHALDSSLHRLIITCSDRKEVERLHLSSRARELQSWGSNIGTNARSEHHRRGFRQLVNARPWTPQSLRILRVGGAKLRSRGGSRGCAPRRSSC